MSSKRVPMTPKLAQKIRTALGDAEMSVDNLVVYEARALSTEAIKRKSGFYNGARFNRSTLTQMAELINKEGHAVPLMIMHETEVLPVGKVFSAEVHDDENGESALFTQFYIPKDKTDLVSDIDNGLIDEVSVGVLTQKALCSECNFDYFGEEATFSHIWNLTCPEGHTIGQDGVHIRAVGLKDFAELSLVGRGAATNPKILPRAKQVIGSETMDRLAASAAPLDARLVTVLSKIELSNTKPQGDKSMDKEQMGLFKATVEEAANLKVELTASKTAAEEANKKVVELTATNETLVAEVAQLKSGNEKVAELSDQLTAATKELTEAAEKLVPHAKAALTASGVAEADLPTTVTALLSLIEEKGLKLHQVFGAGQVSVEAKAGAETDENRQAQFRSEAFKVKR